MYFMKGMQETKKFYYFSKSVLNLFSKIIIYTTLYITLASNMKTNKLLIIILFCFLIKNGTAQNCTGLGQNPGTAFPVCGTASFIQTTVPPCGGRTVPGPCGTTMLTDINPYWYKFTCFTAGTIGFTIAPNTATDDYDWQLFDVTDKNPDDIYTDATLFVACNWSGEAGNTGASAAGTSLQRCDGLNVPTFSSMPALILGHQYILLISHFTATSQSGYSLNFTGGTASITDPVVPRLLRGNAACNGSKMYVKVNKRIKCTSINADGSDFTIVPAIAPITGATGIGCSNSFDTDSVEIILGGIVIPGNYKITVRPNNNLLDNCDNFIPVTDTVKVTVFPVLPTLIDSISKINCAPNILQLVFKDPIKCNSIALDGSDFLVTGTSPVTVLSAYGICNDNGLTNTIEVKLTFPINTAGNFVLRLVSGSDGNTIINECGKETPAGSAISFTTKDTVSALFTHTIKYGCASDTVYYTNEGKNGVNTWQWNFDSSLSGSSKDTSIIYSVFGLKQTSLIVSNGTCSDTASATINLDNSIKAIFESTTNICPGDPAQFIDKSIGSLNNAWLWNFGNGNTSTLQFPPPQLYPSSNTNLDILAQLIVTNSIGCSDTAINTIKIVGNCYIAVPKGFSPNGDGLNDFLYPTNGYKSKNLLFTIYNRGGKKIFETRDWTNKWDGTYKGNPQDPGTYVWILIYTDIETGKKYELKGASVLIR